MKKYRVGFGFDVHKTSRKKRDLVLAGVVIPCSFSLAAVSDGDVVLHAVADAICGATCLGDIGDHFPPRAKKSKNIDSKDIVKFILKKISKKHKISNIDLIIVAEKPRLVKHKKAMLSSLKKIFAISAVNVKIKSKEGLDILGGKNSLACLAVASVVKL
tara:strand:+ start:425 stop:901 length:477 start_codon:yes stop_codon:yes gene_type:complete